VTLRNRVSAAAAAGVLIVVATVSSVLYFIYAASLHSRADATLLDAAQQASTLASRIKQSAAAGRSTPHFVLTVGTVRVQLLPGRPVTAGQSTVFGPLSSRDVAVSDAAQPAYFASVRHGGQQFRIYTAVWAGGGLVRTGQAASADDGTLREAALLLAALTITAAGITYGAARLTAGRVLRPIAELTAAAEHHPDPRPHRQPPCRPDQ